MCASCMDFVTMIHDPHSAPDPFISKSVIEAARQAVFVSKKVHLTSEELAPFFIILGGSLLVWEEA